ASRAPPDDGHDGKHRRGRRMSSHPAVRCTDRGQLLKASLIFLPACFTLALAWSPRLSASSRSSPVGDPAAVAANLVGLDDRGAQRVALQGDRDQQDGDGDQG
ncbi:hypothetical protein, partial [Micromonospora thermarum]|uniref:hypothetical protein n=1 Tax=Micromonospora thermarum TaxID=2720024 RepID=UPI002815E699